MKHANNSRNFMNYTGKNGNCTFKVPQKEERVTVQRVQTAYSPHNPSTYKTVSYEPQPTWITRNSADKNLEAHITRISADNLPCHLLQLYLRKLLTCASTSHQHINTWHESCYYAPERATTRSVKCNWQEPFKLLNKSPRKWTHNQYN